MCEQDKKSTEVGVAGLTARKGRSGTHSHVPWTSVELISEGSFKNVGMILWHTLPSREYQLPKRPQNAILIDMISMSLDPENHCSISGRERPYPCLSFMFFNGRCDFSEQEANQSVIGCDLQKANSVLDCLYRNRMSSLRSSVLFPPGRTTHQ